ncbi:MAG: hypothetical protein O7E51_06760, partial [Acidobacteria bacterium]|nr:hypothetical protein [Acidobacteriota bacterium]
FSTANAIAVENADGVGGAVALSQDRGLRISFRRWRRYHVPRLPERVTEASYTGTDTSGGSDPLDNQ